ncbi:hypothetical protein [Photorhabdus bodei]|uniref:Uncharacterized protein n=1 Tax=Photorhabdus bodei TaxID=2029681 RepID=A0ABX0APK9_9GAMM|nr:hypothetical protein [Photorhabdus bodei]NDK99940.1 hypothetical protein [Photorhabdus bodei]NDL04134.1 hypothetical protein [Photorhabdus bodei]NDL08184.1 hypothetical protein [Photorhabdus bodei]
MAGIAQGIDEWEDVVRDKSISNRAWAHHGMGDGNIYYNPIKGQILFSHWAGMVRVYSSRGFNDSYTEDHRLVSV